MTELAEGASNQILLLAPDLLAEALAIQLSKAEPELKITLRTNELSRHPSLVIWAVETLEMPSAIQSELRRLQENWQPAPVLLILPTTIRLNTEELLQFGCTGLLQDPDFETLTEAIKTILNGGRVVQLKDHMRSESKPNQMTMGLGQWLLLSGCQQINKDLKNIKATLCNNKLHIIEKLILEGRVRELESAKSLLHLLWGPPQFATDALNETDSPLSPKNLTNNFSITQKARSYGTTIKLKEKTSIAVWDAINARLQNEVVHGFTNSTKSLLAIEALYSSRRNDLLIALLNQVDQVIKRLSNSHKSLNALENKWSDLQSELRQEAIRTLTGNYVRLQRNGLQVNVVDELSKLIDLSNTDEELPNPTFMLEPIVFDKPVQLEGQFLPADEPRALIRLELLFSNWLIRTAELISEEILAASAQWPELRQYFLKSNLISTRELERIRNQLNSKNRWQNLVERPIQLYESKRLLYELKQGVLNTVFLTEPRDEELRQLGWFQQQVALLIETRDAISPQLQAIVKRFGDLMVVVLTQVIGRSIGLIGRGIAQGMGRTLGRG